MVADGPTIEGSALYGIQPYEPILLDDAIRIFLPGGASVRQKDNHAAYHVIDHLGSDRVASHQIGHNEYGPMGGVANGTAPRYAGKSWDVATRTYDFLARQYDPTTGRFLSRDPDRTSAGPYAYVNGNPINLVDPDGWAPIHFFFYSKYGTEVPDSTGQTSLRENMGGLTAHSQMLSTTVVVAVLDDDTPIRIPEGEIFGSHMTVISHGRPGSFSVISSQTGERIRITGREFPGYFYDRMYRIFGDDAARIAEGTRSMGILSCYGACRTPPNTGRPNSFAEDFAGVAGLYFPNLENVVASPYEISTGPSKGRTHAGEFELGVGPAHNESDIVSRYMGMESFFGGQYPNDLYRPIPHAEFDSVTKWWSIPQDDGTINREYSTSYRRQNVQRYVRRNARDFPEPALYRIPISSSPDIPPPPDFLPPTLPRE